MEEAIRKAGVLIEALSYIRQFRDRLTVIKIGGSCMERPEALRSMIQDVVFMETVGMRPIVVHGGGKAISRAMEQAGLEPRFVQGRRYTDERTLEIVARVLVEQINASVVEHVEQLGGRAVGLHHLTFPCLFGRKTTLTGPAGEQIDLGRVGEITEVDCRLIENLCEAGVVPVIPCLLVESGWRKRPVPTERLLNINADTAAAAVASALKAEKLVLLTDTPGILRDPADVNSKLGTLQRNECEQLMRNGTIDAGMIPKVQACLECLEAGVRKTHIIDGRLPHSLLLEIYTDKGVGTQIVP
jgi:acetylglutamate kinase